MSHWFSSLDSQPMVFAGIWRRWQYEDKDWVTFAILICAAGEFMTPFHHRMPVILSPEHYEDWVMTPPEQVEQLSTLMVPTEALQARPVSRQVNSPRYDGPDCLTEIA